MTIRIREWPGQNTEPGVRREAICGEKVSITPDIFLTSPQFDVVRAPPGSRATVDVPPTGITGFLAPDLPGVYRVKITAGAFVTALELVAFPRTAPAAVEARRCKTQGPPQGGYSGVLRALANDRTLMTNEVADALTDAAPLPPNITLHAYGG